MTRTSPKRISAIALLLPLFLVAVAFASMHSGAGSTTSAFAAQNKNMSGNKTAKKPAAKTDCSKADDAALASQIKERLSKRASLKNEKNIVVDVKARVATLSGTVSAKSRKAQAVAEAKKVTCVKSVNSIMGTECKNCTQHCCDGICQEAECAEKPKKPK